MELRVATDTAIKAALRKAKPGDVILVAPGSYGPIAIPRTCNGAPGAPITLISETLHAAHIVSTSTSAAAIGGGGIENFVIDGFTVTGGRNGIQVSQNGYDFTDPIQGIVIRRNLVGGPVEDGIKVNGGRQVTIADNVVTGGNDQAVDVDAVQGFDILDNDLKCPDGQAALFVKMGALDGRIMRNRIGDSADGIHIGDTVGLKGLPHGFYPGESVQARNVWATDNAIDVAERPIAFIGARDSGEARNAMKTARTGKAAVLVAVVESKAVGDRAAIPSTNIATDQPPEEIMVQPGSALARETVTG